MQPLSQSDSPAAPDPEVAADFPSRVLRARLRRFLSGVFRAALFAVLSFVLWWLFAWVLDSLSWITTELELTAVSLFCAVATASVFLTAIGEMQAVRVLGLPLGGTSLRHLVWGVTLGASLSLLIVAIQWVAGWVDLESGSAYMQGIDIYWAPGLGWGLLVMAVGAAGEELLFRGYGLQQLMRATHPWVAVVLTSILFGLLHGDNPQFSRLGLLNTALFGLLFGAALVRWRTLWAPFGMHLGWNFSLACVGASVSGLRIKLTESIVVPVGPELLTGGAYGPEASLLTTLAVAVAALVVWKAPIQPNREPVLWD